MIKNQLRERIVAQFEEHIPNPLWDQLWDQPWSQLGTQLHDQLAYTLRKDKQRD